MGQPTRGKTALNRLRQVDVYVALAWSHILSSGSPLIVDLGYGSQAWTALEMRERWLTVNPQLRLLGVEIDPERVAVAQPYVQPGVIDFRRGGFNLTDVLNGERSNGAQVRLIRAYNVLRQYEENAVIDALDTMAQALEIGGLLIEGTSTPSGRIVAFDVYRKTAPDTLTHQELVFGTNFREAIDPVQFQAILPKRLIHHAQDEAPSAFFDAWRRSQAIARGAGLTDVRSQWLATAQILRERFGYAIDRRERLTRRGFLVMTTALPSP
jgi:hypothetical protein